MGASSYLFNSIIATKGRSFSAHLQPRRTGCFGRFANAIDSRQSPDEPIAQGELRHATEACPRRN
jgi:hypothetical protein